MMLRDGVAIFTASGPARVGYVPSSPRPRAAEPRDPGTGLALYARVVEPWDRHEFETHPFFMRAKWWDPSTGLTIGFSTHAWRRVGTGHDYLTRLERRRLPTRAAPGRREIMARI